MLLTIERAQKFTQDRQTMWAFMCNPANLSAITPPYMGFTVLNAAETSTYAGQIIEYHVAPVLGIKLHWVTEITHVKAGEYFVDEQRFGPYAFWHHQHILEDTQEGGTLMKDLVHYKLPLGILGKAANTLFVKKQLESIFNYRHQKLEELFGVCI